MNVKLFILLCNQQATTFLGNLKINRFNLLLFMKLSITLYWISYIRVLTRLDY